MIKKCKRHNHRKKWEKQGRPRSKIGSVEFLEWEEV